MKIVIFPFTKAQLSCTGMMQNIYPQLFAMHEVWGIVPNSLYINPHNPDDLFGGLCCEQINLGHLDLIEQLERNDIAIRTKGDNSIECEAFAHEVEEKLYIHNIEIIDEISIVLEKIGIEYQKYTVSNIKEKFLSLDYYQRDNIHIPVIGVGAEIPFLETGEIIANIQNQLMMLKIRTSVVYSQTAMKFWNVNCILKEDLDEFNFEEKVFYINWFINQVIQREKPEVVLIEIPDGLVEIDDRCINGAGEYPYLYSRAVGFDYFICSLPANNIDPYFLQRLHEILEKRYGFGDITFHISRYIFLMDNDAYQGKFPCALVGKEYISRILSNKLCSGAKIVDFNDRLHIAEWYESV